MKKNLLNLFFLGVLVSYIVLDVVAQTIFYKGVDLSYVNEPEDTGVKYYKNGQQKPLVVMKKHGVNVVRFRLWCNSTWTGYSNFQDIKRLIQRAKSLGLQVLLNFHYSDFWAAPSRQIIPKAWEGVINNTTLLADSVYHYTFSTLSNLLRAKLFHKQRLTLCSVNSLYFTINFLTDNKQLTL